MTCNWRRDWTFDALLAAACAMGFSMPLGRALLALTALLLVRDVILKRRPLRMPASAWFWLAFVVWAAVVTSCWGVNPDKGVSRLNKLGWFAGIPLAASVIDSRARLWSVLQALLLGLGVLAVRVCVANPIAAMATVEAFEHSRRPVSLATALIDKGTLIDGQRLMIGLVGVLSLWLGADPRVRTGLERITLAVRSETHHERRLRVPVLPLLFVLLAAGELLALKRGSWFCTLAVLALLSWRRIPARWLVAAAIGLVLVAVTVTPVRTRLLALGDEFTGRQGGRIVMWTQVAPGLLRDHPWGIGFRSLTPELMRQYATGVERNRDHLHSNFVEMVVSVGWLGLALYLAWMACVLRDAWQSGGLPRPVYWMLVAILLNGLVEYNFADAEIVVIFGLLAGLAAAGRRLSFLEVTTR